MKNLRKLFALVLAVALTLALCLPAFAAGEGSITVNGATVGKTYEIYKIFDLTQSGSAVSYTIDPDWVGFFFNGDGTKTEAGTTYLLDAQPEGGSLTQIVYNGTAYYINLTEGNVAEFANAAQAYSVNVDPYASAEATSSTLVFENVDLGYYLVFPVNATEIGEGYNSICSLTNAAPDAEVNIKGDYPESDKDVDDQDVEVGQVVPWTVTSTVPDPTGYEDFAWILRDTMSEGLTFGDSIEATNFTVTFGDTVIIDAEHPVAAPNSLAFTENGFELSMNMMNYQDYAGQEITITYTAIVNENAVCNYTYNRAELEYGHGTEEDHEHTPPVTIPVYSSEIVIDKYDSENESVKLEGAVFVLYKLDENGDKLYYVFHEATEDADAYVEWVSDIDDATHVTTDENGYAAFEGLESGTYYLHETESPEGYNLLTTDVEVVIEAPASDENGNPVGVSVEKEIANSSGSTLPETGGIGTKIFYILGAVLLVGAGVMLVVRKRVGSEA